MGEKGGCLTGEYGNELFITSNDVEAHNLDLVDFTDIELSALQDIDGDEVAEVFDVYKGAYDGQEVVLYVEQTINETATAI